MSRIEDVSEKRVYAVPRELNDELANIAKNLGVTKAQFLRKAIREQLAQYEPKYIVKDEGVTVHITGVGPELNSKITAIAKDIGISRNSLLKLFLYDISEGYSSEMKLPNKGLNLDD